MANDEFGLNVSSSSSTSTAPEFQTPAPIIEEPETSSAFASNLTEDEKAEDSTPFMISQASEAIIGFPEFDDITSEDAFELLVGEFDEDEIQTEAAQTQLADEMFRIRRAKGESLTHDDVAAVGDALGIEPPKLDINSATTEEVVEAVETYGDQLEAGVRLTLGEDAVKARKEVEFLINDLKTGLRRELLPQVGGKDETGVIEETFERLGKGFVSELGAKFRSDSLKTTAEGLGDPSKDETFGYQAADAVGQFGADLTTIGASSAVGLAVGGPIGAGIGATIGTGVVLADKTARAIETAYDNVFRDTGDRSKSIEGAMIAAPFAVAESVLDALVLKGLSKPILGIGKKIAGKGAVRVTQKQMAESAAKAAAKNPRIAAVVEASLGIGKQSAVTGAEEAVGAALGETGQQLATMETRGIDLESGLRDVALEATAGAVSGGLIKGASTLADTAVTMDIRKRANSIANKMTQDAKELAEDGTVPEITTEDSGQQITQEAQSEEVQAQEVQQVQGEEDVETVEVPPAETTPIESEELQTEPTPIEEATTESPESGEAKTGTDRTLDGKEFSFEVREIPLEQVVVQKDIPNFKEDADPETGVVGKKENQPTKFSEVSGGNIVVLEKDVTADGELEVISGRNRKNIADRDPSKDSISAVVIKESDGFTVEDAKTLDVELNIRDNQGETSDYTRFFERTNVPLEVARERGLLRNVRGRRGYLIGTQASPALRSLFFAKKINETAAAEIANAAPGNVSLQQVAVDQIINKKKSPAEAINVMQVVQRAEGIAGGATQANLFGENDAALQDAERLAAAATALQQEARDTLTRLKRTKQVGKTGIQNIPGVSGEINLNDPKALEAEIARLSDEVKDWSSWATNPELVQRVQEQAALQAKREGVQIGLNLTAAPIQQTQETEETGVDTRQGALFDQAPVRNREFSSPTVFAPDQLADEAPVAPSRKVQRPKQTVQPKKKNRPTVDTKTAVKEVKKDEQVGTKKPVTDTEKAPILKAEEGIKEPLRTFTTPALVRLARSLGPTPEIKMFRGGLNGAFSRATGRVFINQKLPADPEQLVKTLAHEIGHAIDLAATKSGEGSNVLGKFAPLAKHKKQMVGDTKARRLLPTKTIKHEGQEYKVGVAFGQLVVQKRGEPKKKGGKGRFTFVGKLAVPEAVFENYAAQIKDRGLQELFRRVRDYRKSDGPRPITEQFTAESTVGIPLANPVIQEQLWQLSLAWRPFDPTRSPESYIDYRMSSVELYADFISALLNNSPWVKKEFPDLYRAFQFSVVGKPAVQESLNEINELLGKPEEFTELLAHESARDAKLLVDTVRNELNEDPASSKELVKKLAKDGMRVLKSLPRKYMEAMIPLEQISRTQIKAVQKERAKLLNQLRQDKELDKVSKQQIDTRLQAIKEVEEEIFERMSTAALFRNARQLAKLYTLDTKKIEEDLTLAGINAEQFHNYKVANRILGETTANIEWIKKNPEEVKAGIEWIVDRSAEVGIEIDSKISDVAFSELNGQELADAIAPIDNEIFSQDPTGSKRRALVALANKELKQRARLDEDALEESEDLVAVNAILSESFNVRRYLANPNGWDAKEAQNQLDLLKKQLGPERYSTMEEINEEYSERNWRVIEMMRDAGLMSEEFFDRLKLNKTNYANFAVMHHFVDNPVFDAKFHRQMGTFSEIGNTFMSTTARTALMAMKAARQISINTGIQMMRDASPELMDLVRYQNGKAITKPSEIYSKLDSLKLAQLQNRGDARDFSYLVEMVDGRPVLWAIRDDGALQELFNRRSVASYGTAVQTAHGLQRLQKAFFTTLSPRFVFISDKIRNRLNEAQKASGGIDQKFSLLYWHLSPLMRKRAKIATEIAKNLESLANGKISQLPADMPLREEVTALIESGSLTMSFDNNIHPSMIENDSDLKFNANQEFDSISDLIAAFNSVGQENSLIGTGGQLVKETTGKIPVVGALTERFTDWMAQAAQIEEYRTQLIGFQTELDRTDSRAKAARAIELQYGTPRPRGGGSRNAAAEAGFLFWRATAYTPKIIKELAQDNPAAFGSVVGRRILSFTWKIPAFSAIAAGIIATLAGEGDDEDAISRVKKTIDAFSRKMPRYEKSLMNNIPLGFYNSQTKEYTTMAEALYDALFADGKMVKELEKSHWQAHYTRSPISPDERIIARMTYSLMDATSEDIPASELPGQLLADVGSESPDVAPIATTAYQAVEALRGNNPTDYFRQRGVFPHQLHEGGEFSDKAGFFAQFALNKHLPQIFPKPNMTQRQRDEVEKTFKNQPVSSFLGLSNYGEIEDSQNKEDRVGHIRSKRRLKYPSEVKKTLIEYKDLQRIGADNRNRQENRRYEQLKDWKYAVYDRYDNEIGAAVELGDTERVEALTQDMLKDTLAAPGRWKRLRPKEEKRRKRERKKAKKARF